MGRDEKLFTDPLICRPEHWLRKDSEFEGAAALASLPFGQGARMCIGKLNLAYPRQFYYHTILHFYVTFLHK